MSTQETQEMSREQMQSVWDEEAAKHDTPADESQPTIEATPAEKPVAAEEPQKPAAEVAPDPLAGLPDGVRATLDKLADRMRNMEGHIGGLNNGQKQIKELLTASQEAAKQVQDAPTQAEVKAAIKTPEAWQSLKQEFPEWSDAVESFVDSRLAGVAPAGVDSKAIDTLVDAKLAKLTPAIRRELAEDFLETEFEGWKQDINTPEFVEWIGKQDADVKALVNSDKVSDAVKLLRRFKAPPVDPGQAILDARQATLDVAAALPTGAHVPATKRPEDMTPAELWAHEAKLAEKRKLARGY